MPIWIILTDDWELRGNGAGRVQDLQKKPALQLMDVYDRLGVKSTFNLEVMQQLAFEKYSATDSEIRAGRDAWIDTVRTMIDRGFDVQLHLHPQWLDAERVDGWWKLGKRWHIVDYTEAQIERMVDSAISYLQPLIAPRKLVSFRGGSWGMGPPSRAILQALIRHNIGIDVSVVNGSHYDGEAIKLDYTSLESPYFPYRPDLDDVRRKAKTDSAALVEIPTQSVSRAELMLGFATGIASKERKEALAGLVEVFRGTRAARYLSEILHLPRTLAGRRKSATIPDFVMRDPFGIEAGRGWSDFIIDLSLPHSAKIYMKAIDICIQRARRSERELSILVLENHTKDLQRPGDFDRIEEIIRLVQTKHRDVEFRTLSDVAENIGRIL
jgi:hypothetical protein